MRAADDVAASFLDVVHAALAILEREGRIGHRTLKRQLEVSDEAFDDLVAEIVIARQAAVDLDGQVLVWNRGSGSPSSADVVRDAPDEGVAGERRQMTIMFCDLVGSTAMSGRFDPEQLRDILTCYQRAATRAIAPLGGHVAEYLGDGIVVYFGYPAAVEDAAVRAVRAALAIIDAMTAMNRDLVRDHDIALQLRIGIHTGLVVLAEIGDAKRPTALGEVPNVAARLQAVAGPDEIVVSETTERLVRGFFDVEPLGAQSLKGVATKLCAFRVTAAKDVETRFDVALMGQFSAFVGREGESACLDRSWRAVCAGDSRAVLVRGDAGIGKSRLVQALGERIVTDGGQHMKCRCSVNHRNTAYYPIADLVARRLGFRPSDTMDDRITKLREGLTSLGLDDGDDLQCIASVLALRLPEDRCPPPSLLPQHQKRHNLTTLRRAVEQIARQRPLVMTVEDVHWIDPTSAEFFRQLRIPRVLLVLTTRPESDLAWTGDVDPETIDLGRLSKEQSRQLIANVTGGRALPRGLVEELLVKTDGVPLFIEEQTKALLESDMIVERDGVFELIGPLRDMRIAETLQDTVRARLDRLDPESRGIAQLASTFGRSFTHEFLEAVASSMPPTLLHNALTRLLEAGVLLRHGDAQNTTYYFRHALVQDVAYQSLLKTTRRNYHLACADALVTWFPETEQSQPELIAHHCRAAGDTARAVKYYELAGLVAAKHWALQESIDHLRQALTLLEELPDDSKRRRRELGLLFALGPALMSTLGYANKVVEDTYSRIRALCESEGLQAKMFPALVGLWQHNMVGGSLLRARALGAELLNLAESVDDPTFRLIATRSLGTTLFLLGDFRGAFEYTSAGWRMYDIEEHGRLAVTHGNDQGVAHGVYLAWTLWTLGRPDAAHSQARATIELANRLKHPMSIAFSQSYAATVANLRGEFELGASLASAAREVADQHGLALWSAHARTQLGWARIGLGDVAPGLACMEEGIRAWFQTGAGAGGSLMHAVVAETYLSSNDLATADARLSQAEALAAKTGERFYEAEMLRLRGEIASRAAGDAGAGRTFVVRGLEVARAQHARAWELRLLNSLAASLMTEGRHDVARTLLSECLERFDEGAGTRDRTTAERLVAAAT